MQIKRWAGWRGCARSRTSWLWAAVLLSAPGLAQLPPDLELTPLGLSLSNPLAVRSASDGSGRLFFAERSGALLVYQAPSSLSVFLDLTADVDAGGEGGLLGVAFHPQYEQNGYFYVSYTRDGTGGSMTLTTVVERYQVSGNDPDAADPLSRREILTLPQPRWNHNGGDLHFGPDGYLYLSLGDGGGSGAPPNSQNLSNWLGTMLRIAPCVSASCGVPYTVPASNPYVGTAGLDEIWSSGLRNPYRFSFDRMTGDLFIADVGQNSREEVSQQPAGRAGDNYGWPCREGDIPGTSSCSGNFVDPILVYPHSSGNCSITGGYRYRGCIQGLFGAYVYADYCTGRIWAAQEQSPGQWTSNQVFDLSSNVLGFGEDEGGELYVLTNNAALRFDSASNCLPPAIFADSFESGDLTAWSSMN